MTDPEHDQEAFDRRGFFKKMAAASFVVPVVASFQLDSLAQACEPNRSRGGQKQPPGRGFPNQGHCYPNMTYYNQTTIESV